METENNGLSYAERVAKKQLNHMRMNTALTAACFLAVLVAVAFIAPRIVEAVREVQTMVANVNGLIDDASIALDDLKEVTAELAAVDIEGMLSDVDTLVTESTDGMRTAIERLQLIDFSALNKAIADLNSVVGPLAKLFSK